jgi:hypothetical protein
LSGGGTIAANRTLTLDTGSAHFTGGVKSKLSADGVVSSSAQINHDATTNYVANQHIDHTTVSISPGAGMSGGGTIAANRTLTLDTGSAHFTGGVKTKLNTDGVVSGSGQIAINSTTGTLNVDKGGTGQTTYTNGQLLIGNTTGNTLTKATLTAGTGITVTNGGGSITIAAINNGTVTSVGGTGTVSGLTLSGTVTSTGNLTLGGTLSVTPSNFASQTANTFLAAPNGTAGVPTFRAIVAADVPTLNQNTTGTAANVTGTVAVANGGTGATTAAAARTNLAAAANNQTMHVGTTALAINRASAAQTLTGVSIDGNAATVTNGVVTTGNQSIAGDKTFTGSILFGSTTRQMLNLFSTTYALGVQTNTLYFRSASRFSWFRAGVHNNTENTPGTGGSVAMTLDSSSNLVVSGEVTAFSDIRVKKNIEPIAGALDKTLRINGYTYERTDIDGLDKRQSGVIAQELLEIFPEVVNESDEGYYSVAYGKIVPLLIEAIKELKTELDIVKNNCKCNSNN